MPLPTINTSDFAGYTAISSDRFNDAILTDYISVFRIDYIRYFVGDSNYIAIRDAVTNPDKYNDLLNGTSYTDDQGNTKLVTGLTEVVKLCIYFEYVRKQRYANTVNGVEVNRNENSLQNKSANGYVQAFSRYSKAITQYNDEIVPFLQFYRTIEEMIASSIDLGSGNYTINLSSTKYLSDGDTVTIGKVDYTVSNLIANTSFDISGATAGLDFSGSVASWMPYGKEVFCRKLSTFF